MNYFLCVTEDLAPPPQLCVFSMLTELEVFTVSVDVLFALLQKSPVLKKLLLQGIDEFAEERLNSAVVPGCFASLEEVRFVDVDGVKHELSLVKFLMENCMMLQRMIFDIHSQSTQDAEVLKEYEEELYSLGDLNLVFVQFYDYSYAL